MIGIYKITHKKTGKSYIGQSNNIERRFKEHCSKSESAIGQAIKMYGSNSFDFKILEECELNELDDREIYWIEHFNTYKGYGYNCLPGGNLSAGELNNNAKLTEEDVKKIRLAYNNHKSRKEVYEHYKNKITFSSFASVWDGTNWPHIMPEVFTKKNRRYYSGGIKAFSDNEVLEIRKRYVNESAPEIYRDYQERCTYQTLEAILCGVNYKHLPIYKKRKKVWINNG